MEKIIVLGGSFNPPTLAHSILLQSALDALPADRGIYVPSSQAYVARKMRRWKDPLILSEQQRLRLLEAMCREDERLAVSTCEFGDDGRGHSYDTMKRIQKEYPGSELYFLIGADKLGIIPRWHSLEAFFRDFHFAVTARKGQAPEERIRQHPVLSRHIDRFQIVPEPEGIEEISSTMLRKYLKNHDPAAQALVTSALWTAMERIGMIGTYDEPITSFSGEYAFLSNSSKSPFRYSGKQYPDAETCIRENVQGNDAAGRKVTEKILKCKFRQNPRMAERLFATGLRPLVNAGRTASLPGADAGTGTASGIGEDENQLGKMLMLLRSQLREQKK